MVGNVELIAISKCASRIALIRSICFLIWYYILCRFHLLMLTVVHSVTTCERAADALKLLRENKDGFDVVISDVHMPDMDGFKLLELVGLEMDLPVIS